MDLRKILDISSIIRKRKFYKRIVLFNCLNIYIKLDNYIKSENEILIKENGELKKFKSITGLTIVCKGKGNKITIEEPVTFDNSLISVSGDNNTINISKSKFILTNLAIYADSNLSLNIGEDFSCASVDMSLRHTKEVNIGNDCMCSDNVMILGNDGHPIIDEQSKTLMNPMEECNIEIGNHVWLGRRSVIAKNSKISDNTIVGISAIVTKKFEDENIALAGVPAKIVKTGINWKREF